MEFDTLNMLARVDATIDRMVKSVGNPREFVETLYRRCQQMEAVARTVMDVGDVPANMSELAANWLQEAQELASAYPSGESSSEGTDTAQKSMTGEDFARYAVAELDAASKEEKASLVLRRLAALKHAIAQARPAFADALAKADVTVRNDIITTLSDQLDKTITDTELQSLNKSVAGAHVAALVEATVGWPCDMNAKTTETFGRDPA